MKKKIFMAIFIVVILIVIIMQSDYFYYNSDKITANKIDGSLGLTLNIKNHFIEKRSTLKFVSSKDLEDMAKIISEQNYKVMYGKTDESVYIFDDEVYTLNIYEEKNSIFGKRYIYSMIQAELLCIESYQTFYNVYIPFPRREVISEGTSMKNKMEIKCGFKYLKEFFENVETATVYEDMIDVDAIIYDYRIGDDFIDLTDKYVRIKYEGDNVISFEVLDKE